MLFLLSFAVLFIASKITRKPKVNIDELVTKIKEEHESGNFSLQAIFNRNVQHIEKLKSEGYSYKTILDKLDIGLRDAHSRDLLRKAKIKNGVVPTKTVSVTTIPVDNKPVPENPIKGESVVNVELSEWEKIGITNPVLIKKINRAQLTPSEIKSWNCANEMQITKRVTEILIKNKG
jgi:hypothetical protein